TNTARNLVLQPAPGDWALETKVDVPQLGNQQGGLIAYQDDNDYLKLDVEYNMAGTSAQILATMEDFSATPIAPATNPLAIALVPTDAGTGTTHPVTVTPNESVWLKMIKTGQRYALSYSLDGTTWKSFYEVGASLKNVGAGVFAYNRGATTSSLAV